MSKARANIQDRSGAFTLVELLIVVVILALLIALLLPPLNQARKKSHSPLNQVREEAISPLNQASEKARGAVCRANLRALGKGFAYYAESNNDWYPAGCGWGDQAPTWDKNMLEYYEDKELLHCPSDREPRPSGISPRSYAINIDVTWMGPSAHGNDQAPPYDGETPPFPWPGYVHKITEVEIPSDTVLLGDMWVSGKSAPPVAGRHNHYSGCGIFFYKWDGNDNTYRTVTYHHRNNDAANFLFCDGHAATLSKDDPKIASTTSEDPEDAGYYWLREGKGEVGGIEGQIP